MNSHDFELEELVVAKAIGLSLQGLDLVVCTLQKAGRGMVIVMGRDASPMEVPGSTRTS